MILGINLTNQTKEMRHDWENGNCRILLKEGKYCKKRVKIKRKIFTDIREHLRNQYTFLVNWFTTSELLHVLSWMFI